MWQAWANHCHCLIHVEMSHVSEHEQTVLPVVNISEMIHILSLFCQLIDFYPKSREHMMYGAHFNLILYIRTTQHINANLRLPSRWTYCVVCHVRSSDQKDLSHMVTHVPSYHPQKRVRLPFHYSSIYPCHVKREICLLHSSNVRSGWWKWFSDAHQNITNTKLFA